MSGWSSCTSSRSIASSRSASARAGSYTTSKALTALAADALKLALAGTETKQQGDHFIHLQSELGDRRYRKLCEDADLTLTAIHYCQEGLDIAVRINQLDESLKQVKDLINHDYLVLTLQPGDGTEVLHVMAHKLRGGVHVSHVDGGVLHDGVRCFTVPCCKRMRLWEMVAILKLEDPDYCLRSSNCWDYAKNTAKRLVKACAEVGGVSAAERARLLKEHDGLEANLAFRHMENVAKSLIRRFAASPSRDSATPGDSHRARVSSFPRAPELASSLINSPAASDILARVPNSPKAPELSSPLIDSSAAPDIVPRISSSSSELSSSLFETPAVSATLARVSKSTGAAELSSPPTASDLARLGSGSARFQDLQQAADPVALVMETSELENSELVRSGRVVEQLSPRAANQSGAFPSASSGKVCLQIVFLMFWLVLKHVGLGPWVTSLFGSIGSG